ncbi:hypothetical protein BDV93DRAFT_31506 [Ceratobasidium sp. AG-I]|nr:hypothetical protein BDV93DRAFT_31506 [Ceratobasidium sp. AG-I]
MCPNSKPFVPHIHSIGVLEAESMARCYRCYLPPDVSPAFLYIPAFPLLLSTRGARHPIIHRNRRLAHCSFACPTLHTPKYLPALSPPTGLPWDRMQLSTAALHPTTAGKCPVHAACLPDPAISTSQPTLARSSDV